MAVYVSKYTSQGLNERAFDAHAATFAEFPDVDMKLQYSEKMSPSDQAEKMERSVKTRVVGKKHHYLYRIDGSEHGCGENSGSEAKAHVVHAAENHLDLAKTFCSRARASYVPAKSTGLSCPSLQILDNAARFHILVQFAPELFIMREILDGSCPFPRKDQHTQQVVDLGQFFLVMRSVTDLIRAFALEQEWRRRAAKVNDDKDTAVHRKLHDLFAETVWGCELVLLRAKGESTSSKEYRVT
ncbi:hypothetical protein HDU90_006755 [Geranomyces variabilis]|nr:hypothetical protein HDU90_006755 [Geranomyces variabilis]